MSHTPDVDFENQRILELDSYNILDTLTEPEYDDITFLASVMCQVPIALISFVDEKRQWFKSHKGLSMSETSREYSFCSCALNNPREAMIVPDLRADDRFKNNPLVTGDPNFVFYAGFPLVSPEGFPLGTVCVIDKKSRTLSADQVRALQILSVQVMKLLDMRKTVAEMGQVKVHLEMHNIQLQQFAMVVAHDIKSPLSTILSANQLLTDINSETGEEDAVALLNASNESAKKIKSLVDGILSYYKDNAGEASYETIDLSLFFAGFRQTITSPKPCRLTYAGLNTTVFFNKTQLEQIFFNFISNSIRYNNQPAIEIRIESNETADYYGFSITDNGIGISKENKDKIFNLFTTVSPRDALGTKGSGIGLTTVKKIIKDAGGNIEVQSEPGKGTTFLFRLPKRNHVNAIAEAGKSNN